MKTKINDVKLNIGVHKNVALLSEIETIYQKTPTYRKEQPIKEPTKTVLPEILVITSYPPRECGIATYSQDLIKAMNKKFSNSLDIKVCAMEAGKSNFNYPAKVKYTLDTTDLTSYSELSENINHDDQLQLVLIQHEFGFFQKQENSFLKFLYDIKKPVIIVFHTVLPNPDEQFRTKVKNIASACQSVIVMTKTSARILEKDYDISPKEISVIAHGTHLVSNINLRTLKEKYGLAGKKVLTTFGLLSSGKSIETTLEALPTIIKNCPEVMFLIIGKTHPEVVKNEGEKYRHSLEQKVNELGIHANVTFINKYLSLPNLLEYLQLTDIYLFTTNDPNQAVSGTFVYAMSCGCPIISTPIPHAKEVLTKDTGIIFDFKNSNQLALAVNKLLTNNAMRKEMRTNTLQKIVSTAWENSAVAHTSLFQKTIKKKLNIRYNHPPINLHHLKEMTTDVGMIQFSKISQPDLSSGYTLDDNARALLASCMHLEITGEMDSINGIRNYVEFIKFCQQTGGNFLNYVDKNSHFTTQNEEVNLDDSNGRAMWALGYLISIKKHLPLDIVTNAEDVFKKALPPLYLVTSSRSMAFIVKGLYYYQKKNKSLRNVEMIKMYADRLVQMYKHESSEKWAWFESYLTYANSVLPEAMLYAYLGTKDEMYKKIAITSFNFLLEHIFNENGIEVISNKSWLKKGEKVAKFGEQPIDVAYTIMTLSAFYDAIGDEQYYDKMIIAFNWFLGKNRLSQTIYNPCTGGCYDGLEEFNVNLNQGAESTLSYLLARLTIEKYEK